MKRPGTTQFRQQRRGAQATRTAPEGRPPEDHKDKKKKKIKTKKHEYEPKKDSKFTKKQVNLQAAIKEKSHGQYPKGYFAKLLKKDKHGKFRGKVYDAPPTTLVKAGMTGKQGSTGLPGHSISSTTTKGKLTDFKVKPYGGSIKTGFKGYDMKDTSKKGFKSGGRIGLKYGGSVGAAIRGRGAEIK